MMDGMNYGERDNPVIMITNLGTYFPSCRNCTTFDCPSVRFKCTLCKCSNTVPKKVRENNMFVAETALDHRIMTRYG